MKKIMLLLILAVSLQSCATIFGGHIDESQRRKPAPGELTRKIRPVAFIADCLLLPISSVGLALDFANCSIYKPEKKGK